MYNHSVANGIVKGHPLVVKLASHLKRKHIPETSVSFVRKAVNFAYPRTLWVKFAASTSTDLRHRHELDPNVVGQAIKEWLIQHDFRRVVLDLREVTIVGLDHIKSFSACFQSELTMAYLCDRQSAPLLGKSLQDIRHPIFYSETETLNYLRAPDSLRSQEVSLPAYLSLSALDKAMTAQASIRHLHGRDIVTLGFGQVFTADFEALSFLQYLP